MQIDPKRMKRVAADASGLFSVLSNPRRLMILCRLVDGEANVGELASFCGGTQSSVSQHLALLRSSGLVATRRQAQTIYYRLASAPARGIMQAAYEGFCRPAKARGETMETKS
jgi:DNA-binding transcriptional ArsR family regulator